MDYVYLYRLGQADRSCEKLSPIGDYAKWASTNSTRFFHLEIDYSQSFFRVFRVFHGRSDQAQRSEILID